MKSIKENLSGMSINPKLTVLSLSLGVVLISGCSMNQSNMDHQANDIVVETAPAMPSPSPMPQAKRLSKASIMPASATLSSGMVVPREGSRNIASNTEKYQSNETNPVKAVAQEPVSTFSVDVDTGSYSNVRRFLNHEGRLPPVDAVRIEELINYFPYQYPQVKSAHPFTVNTETVDSPWQENAKVIRIGIKANDIEYKELPAANLVFLVDVSGSMNQDNKLPLVKRTLRILTEQLRPQDKVTIVTYSSGEQVVLEPTSGRDKDKILKVINSLQASGATSGERAIQMAYEQAQKSLIKNGINRILIATDGDFNVGITDFNTLKGMIAEKRKSGISFTALGYGTGNYNEQLMEQLADAGDGNYSYIDNENEAKKVVQRQISSTLATVAQDVKIQVEFNPAKVKEYRLIGYENRMLKQEDFNNDKVDAGDIGAGHTVTALYEIIPVGQKGWLNDSRYKSVAPNNKAQSNELAFLNLRYKQPNQTKSILLSQPILNQAKKINQASADTQFAIAVASYGQQLKGGQYNGSVNWDGILKMAESSRYQDQFGMKSEFVDLVKTAKSLSAKQN